LKPELYRKRYGVKTVSFLPSRVDWRAPLLESSLDFG
jgi:hypothetical protein